MQGLSPFIEMFNFITFQRTVPRQFKLYIYWDLAHMQFFYIGVFPDAFK
jgi:hypothetical protein